MLINGHARKQWCIPLHKFLGPPLILPNLSFPPRYQTGNKLILTKQSTCSDTAILNQRSIHLFSLIGALKNNIYHYHLPLTHQCKFEKYIVKNMNMSKEYEFLWPQRISMLLTWQSFLPRIDTCSNGMCVLYVIVVIIIIIAYLLIHIQIELVHIQVICNLYVYHETIIFVVTALTPVLVYLALVSSC